MGRITAIPPSKMTEEQKEKAREIYKEKFGKEPTTSPLLMPKPSKVSVPTPSVPTYEPGKEVPVSPGVARKLGMITPEEEAIAREKKAVYVITPKEARAAVEFQKAPGVPVSPGIIRKAGLISEKEYREGKAIAYKITPETMAIAAGLREKYKKVVVFL